jgi:hypothetical protein
MGWDKGGRYYTRSRRENGRVVREYVGGGTVGQLAARMDAIVQEKREADRALLKVQRDELAALDAPLDELNELADLLVRAAQLAAGFRRHNRGEWRRPRAQHDHTD